MVHPGMVLGKSVGVAMSGGGAKGLYHIGTLKALEENGIPIDYVAGTSMGAIIAGLYAAGYSPQQMQQLATSGMLEAWATGYIDHTYSAYFREGSTLRHDAPTLTFRFDPNKKSIESQGVTQTRMPQSLISTTPLDLALVELFAPAGVACEGDFDELMVPFLCVASDVTNDKAVVMDSGDLGLSVRASMALPLAFKPIIDKHQNMLYDGGIQDNFPWRPMIKRFNPDLVIGSACGKDMWAHSSNLSLMDQAFILAMTPSNYDLPRGGVLIAREVPGGMLDFASADKVIEMGYDDTMAQMEQIKSQLSQEQLLSQEFYDARREAFRERCPELIFGEYDISRLTKEQSNYVHSYMQNSRRQQRKGSKEERDMTMEELRTSLYSIMARGDFNTDYPDVEYNADSALYRFSVDMEYKPSLRLSLGGNLSSTPYNQVYMGASYTTIKRVARSLFAELYLGPVYTTGRLGYRADFYRAAPMFIDFYYNFAVNNLDHGDFSYLTQIDNAFGIKSADQFFSTGLGTPLNLRSMVVVRANLGVDNIRYNYGLPTLSEGNDIEGVAFDKSRFKYFAVSPSIESSTIDDPYFPTKGLHLSGSIVGVGAQERSYVIEDENNPAWAENHYDNIVNWYGAKLSALKYLNLDNAEVVNLGLNAEGVYTTIPDMITQRARQIMMPAYQPTTHSKMVYMPEFSAPRYVAAGVMPSIRFWRQFYLRTGFYTMMTDNFDYQEMITSGKGYSLHYIAQAALAYKSSIGPIRLTVAKYGIENWNNLYLTFNFGATIFSPRGVFY